MSSEPTILKTRIYVDGYNIYYGVLKRTPYKWLDLRQLFNHILPTVLYEENGIPARFTMASPEIKYFTAPILKKFASSDDSVPSQVAYHAALQAHLAGAIQLSMGRYDAKKARAYLASPNRNPRESSQTEVWKLEEKQSDVALAVHAVHDALTKEVDQVVFVTNDTDLVPAMEIIRKKTNVVVGLIVPTKKNIRQKNKGLDELSHWSRDHITDEELKNSQLPTPIQAPGKSIQKPISWYPRPDLLHPILEEAKRVCGSSGAAWKWLNEPSEKFFGGKAPIELTENEEGAAKLREYQEQYKKDFDTSPPQH
jgi:6-hydroxy-3-succinoylpyridine 3-monooxygenase